MRRLSLILLWSTLAAAAINGSGAQGGSAEGSITSNGAGIPNVTTSWTLALWIKSNSTITNQVDLVTRINGAATDVQLYLYIDATGHVSFWKGAANVFASTGTVTNTSWHSIVVTRSSNTWTLYIDGAQDTQVTDSFSQSASTYDLSLMENNAGNKHFQGRFAEVALLDTPWTAGEVAAYAKGTPPNHLEPSHLVFYYPMYFNQTNVGDMSGHARTAVSNNQNGSNLTADHCPCSPPAGTATH